MSAVSEQGRSPRSRRLPRLLIGYSLLVSASILAFQAISAVGERAFGGAQTITVPPPVAASGDVIPHVLLALVVIIVAARTLGALFERLHQPPVMGEIVAGILLGPSTLGYFAPEASQFLLPPEVVRFIGLISHVGVIFFMFLVGVQLESSHLRGRGESAIAISHASIIVPFLLGAGLALLLYPIYGVNGVPFTGFALFLGVAMSVTAFPVLARILADRGMQRTPLGTLALTVASVDDVTAWFLLAFVVGVVRAKMGSAVLTGVLTFAYIIAMVTAVRPAVRWFIGRHPQATRSVFAAALVGLLLSALTAEVIGIHAVFGAFLMGVVIPARSSLARELVTKLEDLTVVVFLPAFFAFTGLRTKIGLVQTASQWLVCGLIVATATAGKFGGTIVGARLARVEWRDAVRLGILMNTRGLMELVVLNVALDLGILSPIMFAMMVIMAVVTTFMTTPLLDLVAARDTG